MVEIQALSKRYPVHGSEDVGLVDFDLMIAEGEFLCLLGPSGCGKSTLLKLAAGLITPSSGIIRINGRPVIAPGPDRAVVFQDYALFPWMTVRENAEFGLAARGLDSARRRAISGELLRLVRRGDFAEEYPHHRSTGKKQRAAIEQ